MADNTELNLGSGGDLMRTLDDGAAKWPASVAAFTTTVSPGANVLQFVDASHGLPVEVIAGAVEVTQSTAANLKALVEIAAGQTVAATQSGDWTVKQATAANLKALVDINTGQSITVTQSTAANLKAVVEIAAGQSVAATQSGDWIVKQATASNLKALVDINSGQSVGISGDVTVKQSTAANLKATVNIAASQTVGATQSGTWTVNVSGGQTIGVSGNVTVVQATAANLNATAVLAAGTKMAGKISAGIDSGTVYSGATALSRKFAKIDASSSGNNTIVSASSGNRLRVLRWGLTANGDVGVKWRSGSSTDLTGVRPLTQYASAGGAYTPVGIFETAKNEAFVLNLSAAVAVGGELTYVEVPESGGVVPGDPGNGGGLVD